MARVFLVVGDSELFSPGNLGVDVLNSWSDVVCRFQIDNGELTTTGGARTQRYSVLLCSPEATDITPGGGYVTLYLGIDDLVLNLLRDYKSIIRLTDCSILGRCFSAKLELRLSCFGDLCLYASLVKDVILRHGKALEGTMEGRALCGIVHRRRVILDFYLSHYLDHAAGYVRTDGEGLIVFIDPDFFTTRVGKALLCYELHTGMLSFFRDKCVLDGIQGEFLCALLSCINQLSEEEKKEAAEDQSIMEECFKQFAQVSAESDALSGWMGYTDKGEKAFLSWVTGKCWSVHDLHLIKPLEDTEAAAKLSRECLLNDEQVLLLAVTCAANPALLPENTVSWFSKRSQTFKSAYPVYRDVISHFVKRGSWNLSSMTKDGAASFQELWRDYTSARVLRSLNKCGKKGKLWRKSIIWGFGCYCFIRCYGVGAGGHSVSMKSTIFKSRIQRVLPEGVLVTSSVTKEEDDKKLKQLVSHDSFLSDCILAFFLGVIALCITVLCCLGILHPLWLIGVGCLCAVLCYLIYPYIKHYKAVGGPSRLRVCITLDRNALLKQRPKFSEEILMTESVDFSSDGTLLVGGERVSPECYDISLISIDETKSDRSFCIVLDLDAEGDGIKFFEELHKYKHARDGYLHLINTGAGAYALSYRVPIESRESCVSFMKFLLLECEDNSLALAYINSFIAAAEDGDYLTTCTTNKASGMGSASDDNPLRVDRKFLRTNHGKYLVEDQKRHRVFSCAIERCKASLDLRQWQIAEALMDALKKGPDWRDIGSRSVCNVKCSKLFPFDTQRIKLALLESGVVVATRNNRTWWHCTSTAKIASLRCMWGGESMRGSLSNVMVSGAAAASAMSSSVSAVHG